MMSTAMDYARFVLMLRNGGTLEGKRIIGPKTLAYMTADHLGTAIATTPLYLPGPGHGFGLGFAVRKASGEAAIPAAEGTYYWGGAGGTYFWVDPKEEMIGIVMTQVRPYTHLNIRQEFQVLANQAIVDGPRKGSPTPVSVP
jgi:CubicO group peptidase (beta-lactamase class C family)